MFLSFRVRMFLAIPNVSHDTWKGSGFSQAAAPYDYTAGRDMPVETRTMFRAAWRRPVEIPFIIGRLDFAISEPPPDCPGRVLYVMRF